MSKIKETFSISKLDANAKTPQAEKGISTVIDEESVFGRRVQDSGTMQHLNLTSFPQRNRICVSKVNNGACPNRSTAETLKLKNYSRTGKDVNNRSQEPEKHHKLSLIPKALRSKAVLLVVLGLGYATVWLGRLFAFLCWGML